MHLNQIILALGQSLHTSSSGSPHPVKKIQKNFKNNYASVECGAKILSANSEAKVTHAWVQHTFYCESSSCWRLGELYDDLITALME